VLIKGYTLQGQSHKYKLPNFELTASDILLNIYYSYCKAMSK